MTDTCTPAVPDSMQAAVIEELGPMSAATPRLRLRECRTPRAGRGEVLIRNRFCGVCHTELDEIEGRTAPREIPMIPGHQVIGTVVASGPDCRLDLVGKPVGVAWIHSACGECRYCLEGLENLCSRFQACGRDHAGGYAEYMTAPETFVHLLPGGLDAAFAAPLLCAGAVGYRALALTGLENGAPLGLTGFGSSGQLVLPMARHLYPDSPIFVFARSAGERAIALKLGAAWAGDTAQPPPQAVRAIIDTTPAWLPVLSALESLEAGGRLVVNAIRKEAHDQALLAGLDYARHLWLEKSLTSVANVTRADVRATLALASRMGLTPRVCEYPLEDAVPALLAIRSGTIEAAGVLRIPH